MKRGMIVVLTLSTLLMFSGSAIAAEWGIPFCVDLDKQAWKFLDKWKGVSNVERNIQTAAMGETMKSLYGNIKLQTLSLDIDLPPAVVAIEGYAARAKTEDMERLLSIMSSNPVGDSASCINSIRSTATLEQLHAACPDSEKLPSLKANLVVRSLSEEIISYLRTERIHFPLQEELIAALAQGKYDKVKSFIYSPVGMEINFWYLSVCKDYPPLDPAVYKNK